MIDKDAYIIALEDLVHTLESEIKRFREKASQPPPVQRSFDFDVHED